MGRVATLRLSLETESAKFTKGLTKAQYQAKKFKGNIEKTFNNLSTSISDGFSGAISGALGGLTQINAHLGEFAKEAKNARLSFLRFTEVAQPLNFLGLDPSGLRSMMATFQEAIADAIEDPKSDKGIIFKRFLGFSDDELKIFSFKEPQEQLKEILKMINRIPKLSDQTRVTAGLFGSDAELIGKLFTEYGGDIDKINRKLAERKAIIRPDDLKAVEELNSELKILNEQFNSLFAEGLNPFNRELTKSVKAISDFLKENKELIISISKTLVPLALLVGTLASLGITLFLVKFGIGQFIKVFAGLFIITRKFFKDVIHVNDLFRASYEHFSNLEAGTQVGKRLNVFRRALGRLIRKLNQFRDTLDRVKLDFKKFRKELLKHSPIVWAIITSFHKLVKWSYKLGKLILKVTRWFVNLGRVLLVFALLNPFGLALIGAHTLLTIGIGLIRKYNEFFSSVETWIRNKWNDAIDYIKLKWGEFTEYLSNKIENIKTWFVGLGTAIKDGIVNGFKTVKTWLTENIFNWLNDKIQKLWDLLPESVRKKLGIATSVAKKYTENVVKYGNTITSGVGNAITTIGSNFWNDLTDTEGWKIAIDDVGLGFKNLKDNTLSAGKAVIDFGKEAGNVYSLGYEPQEALILGFYDKLMGKSDEVTEKIKADSMKAGESLDLLIPKITEFKDMSGYGGLNFYLPEPSSELKELKPVSDLQQNFADAIAEGIVSGFEDDGVKGAIQGFIDTLVNDLRNDLVKDLSSAFLEILGFESTKDLFKSGLNWLGFNDGGVVPGVGNTDSVPALLTPGEVVINPKKGQSYGEQNMINYNINAIDASSFKQMIARDPSFIYSVTEAGRRMNTGLGAY